MPRSDARSYSFLLYLLAFFLFWEWLRPLTVITDTANIDYFIGFAAFSLFLSYLRFPIWITSPAKLIALIYALHMLFFYNTSLFNGLWIEFFLDDLKNNIIFVIEGNWVGLTNLFRSFLFFVLLWIVSYLMHFWLIQTRKLFLFFFVTIIYLTVLDTFTMYHADGAIVRTMIIGLILLGLLRVLNIQDRESVTFDKGRLPVRWILPLVVIIGLAAVVGFAAPKAGPLLPDPVPYITKATNGYGDNQNGKGIGGSNLQTIGYDSDDTKLGGAFIMDNTPVFSTVGKHSHYWRVATKDGYTGKGWVIHTNQNDSRLDYNDLSKYPFLKMFEKDVQIEKDIDTVHFLGKAFPQLIYGGAVLNIEADQMDELHLDNKTGELQPMFHGRHVTLGNYKVNYEYPTFSIPKLKRITGGDPDAIKKQYLQLPENLPNRIRNLAQSITEDYDNRYDKANAIVNYFQSGDYQYDTKNIPVPGKDEDYVDQFLFDTKRGYCDNFSTSMAVMLRTIGIPTRWVKGFTAGEYKSTPDENQYEYIIKNSDAHSWVEVYFPGSGWVPFEPTKGFDNIAQFNYSDSKTDSQSQTPAVKNNEKKKPNKPEPKEQSQSKKDASVFSHINFKIVYNSLYAILVILFIATLILYRTRKKWLPIYILKRYHNRTDPQALEQALKRLLKLLSLYGYYKKPHQTLREFASVVDRALGINDMKQFTLAYEKGRYYQPNTDNWLESKQYWEKIIIKLRG
ncbi:MAG: transglutaminaseTgpA domain-containing protein [Tuberibacillus sp.]